MREILKKDLEGMNRIIIVMRSRSFKDPIFLMYYNYKGETDVQKTVYTLSDVNDYVSD